RPELREALDEWAVGGDRLAKAGAGFGEINGADEPRQLLECADCSRRPGSGACATTAAACVAHALGADGAAQFIELGEDARRALQRRIGNLRHAPVELRPQPIGPRPADGGQLPRPGAEPETVGCDGRSQPSVHAPHSARSTPPVDPARLRYTYQNVHPRLPRSRPHRRIVVPLSRLPRVAGPEYDP